MIAVNRGLKRSIHHLLMLLAAGALVASPAIAQINTVDPNDAIDSDLGTPPPATAPAGDTAPTVQDGVPTDAPRSIAGNVVRVSYHPDRGHISAR